VSEHPAGQPGLSAERQLVAGLHRPGSPYLTTPAPFSGRACAGIIPAKTIPLSDYHVPVKKKLKNH
jgi:hypothetical protein